MPNTTVSTDFTLYSSNGLSWMSNLSYVHPRNNIGNIILQESSSSNPILIIEPIKYNYTNESVVDVIDTRFRFFQFPVSTITTETDFSLDTNIDFSYDTTTKKFTIPADVDGRGQLSTYKRIGTLYKSDWFYNGEQEQQGYTRIPFQTDNGEGSYEITADILKYARSRNQVIKFTIYVATTSAWKDEYDIDPRGRNTSFQMIIGRTETYDAWESWNGTDKQPLIYTEDSGRLGNDPKTGKPWILPDRKDSAGNPIPMAGMFGENEYPGLYIEYIIDPVYEKPGRRYFAAMSAGSPSWILSDACRWDVVVIDKPTAKPLWPSSDIPNSATGVYNIGNKNQLQTGTRKLIATRFNSDDIKYTNGVSYNRFVTNQIVVTTGTTKASAGEYKQQVDAVNAQKQLEENRQRATILINMILQAAANGSSNTDALLQLQKLDPELATATLQRAIQIRAQLS